MTGAPSDYYGFTRTELQRLEVNLETSTLTARKPIPSKLAEEREHKARDQALFRGRIEHAARFIEQQDGRFDQQRL